MAAASKQAQTPKIALKPVEHYDVNDIAPDAPAGEWDVCVSRGKGKAVATKKGDPMITLYVRLEKTDEEGEEFVKALGTELRTNIIFGLTGRGDKMNKQRLRHMCEAADVDIDVIPKAIRTLDDLQPLIRALEGKKFKAWTTIRLHSDTGEEETELQFLNPHGTLAAPSEDEDEEASPGRKNAKGKGRH